MDLSTISFLFNRAVLVDLNGSPEADIFFLCSLEGRAVNDKPIFPSPNLDLRFDPLERRSRRDLGVFKELQSSIFLN